MPAIKSNKLAERTHAPIFASRPVCVKSKSGVDRFHRSPPEQPFDGKPIAIMGASPGSLGSARAQYHLRQCFLFLNAHLLNRPEVMITQAQTKFDADGKLTDQTTRDFIAALLASFKAWILRMRSAV